MDLRMRHRSHWQLVLVLFAFTGLTTARRHRHGHGRDKRQHSPGSYVLDVPGPEVGDWGPWSAPGPCSRTCGGGVTFQTRQCREDARIPCEGAARRYFSCNIQDCPEGSVDFRAEQCAAFNNVPFDDVYYSWIPYTKAPNKCELNCMPRGERFYYRHKDKVADGTRCDEEKLDVCVDGKCLPVGCDKLLGSVAREDQCRECGGDGSSCNTVRRLLDMDDLQVGYNDLLLIPAGATNIRIQETKPSNNYLAIRNLTGHYYLNGNWRIDFPRSIRACGTIFHYERKPHGFFAPEMISALGPTTEPIYIVLLYQERNPGIEYEYSIPKGAVQDTDPDSYTWVYNEFGPCSATCGGGVQTRNVWCAKRKDSAEASRDLCNEVLEPPSTQLCAPEPCAPQWTTGDWGPCSQPCGTGGVQTRQVICEQIISGGRSSLVNASACEDTLGPAPPTTQPCPEGAPCPMWHIGPWKPCDKLCGDGLQRRDVICFHKVDGRIEKLTDEQCPGPKPDTEMPCKLRPCEGVDWVTTDWSGCEDKCGLSYETRQAFCATEKGEIYHDNFCHKSQVPELKRECIGVGACKHQWFASQWSECSAQCGSGIQTRKVFCGTFTDEGVEKAEEDKCDTVLKYEDTKNCTGEEECKGNWFAGPWSACSKPCGGGQRTRKVLCMLNNVTVPATQCDVNLLLFASEDCNNIPCGTDQIITVTPEHKVDYDDYEDYDEDCEEYEDEFITPEGVEVFSTDLEEGSGSSPGLGDATLFTAESDLSSLSSEAMLSDSPSTLGISDTSLLVSFGSSEYTEESGSASPTFEGSGDSLQTTLPSSETSDITSESSSIGSSSGSTESSNTEMSSSDISSTESSDASSASSIGLSTDVSADSSTESSTDSSLISENVTTPSAEGTSLVSETSSLSDLTTPSTEDTESSTEESTPTTEQSSTESTETSNDQTTISLSSSDSVTEIETTTEFISSSGSSLGVSDGSSTMSSEESTTADFSTVMSTLSSDVSSSEVSTDMSSALEESSSMSSESLSSESVSEESSISPESSSVGSSESSFSVPSESSTIVTSESSLDSSPSSPVLTDDYSSTSPSYGASTSELISIFSQELTTAATKAKKKMCKRRKKKSACLTSEFGCCYDNVTPAKGPFNKGCPLVETCKDTKHGCCPDGVSPAKGPKLHGCPPSQCNLTLFGCCPDGVSISQGNDFDGCPEEPTTPSDCRTTEFGCCLDGATAASGTELDGCPECEASDVCDCNVTKFGCCPDGRQPAFGPDKQGCDLELTTEESVTVYDNGTDCENSTYGCCPDGIIAASGPEYEGCEDLDTAVNCSETAYGCCPDGNTTATGPGQQGCLPACAESQFGCCQDGVTPAHGPSQEGCCLLETYGCCPDNILTAQGPNLEGCGCQYTTHGCCPDNKTAARGPNNQGCGCQYTTFGCCPNQYTPAAGPGYQGCPCYTYQFGCCPDGVTRAIGPNLQGCGCENTEFGCCPDGRTPAPGLGQPCPCVASLYGCCPDGVSEAMGEHFEGCTDIPLGPGELCTLPKDRGTCRDFTVKWFYDTEYGGCSRFWYGGCEGNENRFKSQEECKQTCVEPPGRDACFLPKIEGPCDGYYPTWYYDAERKQCGQFVYGGCLGNGNKFETREQCEELCVTPDTLDACEKPADEGLCKGNFTRWVYDKEADSCTTFNYGGCRGNNNNFLTELACQQKCMQPGRSREQHTCILPALVGDCHNYTARWYYDSLEAQCRQFYYGGCGGNHNNFQTQEECQQTCDRGYVPPPPPPPPEQDYEPPVVPPYEVEEPAERQPQPSQPFTTDMCFLRDDAGDCQESNLHFFYDSRDGVCKHFLYSGCGGNGNRFTTIQECEIRCGNVQDLCSLPQVVGPCDGVEPQYYYDQRTDSCYPFDYGGCQGNTNRFASVAECEQRCRRAPPIPPTSAPTAPPAPPRNNICYLPVDKGPCNEQLPAWFFDPASGQCQTFVYGGCQGNANRFGSIEQCERQCGEFLGQDVCNVPVDVGPCLQHLSKWYFDPATRSCQEFSYGGCDGSSNRFSSLPECESVCLHREELIPENNGSMSYLAICKLPVDSGPCLDGEFQRWAFDERQQTCVAFTYHGCAGNLNRFKSFKACLDYCIPGHSSTDTVNPNIIDVDNDCASIEATCTRLSCPYGVERWVDGNGCDSCRCYNPCLSHNCPVNTTCAITLATNQGTGQTEYKPICRELHKEGECPQLSGEASHCTEECSVDAECAGIAKCCYNGCGKSCLEPVSEHVQTSAPETYHPGGSPPEIYAETTEVEADEGYFVTLQCSSRGNPTPVMLWIRGGSTLSEKGGRYKFLTDGSLQIVGLVPSDAGEYTCVADNGVGEPARKVFHVRIRGPKERPAAVLGDDSQSVIVSLGSRAVLQCFAYGYPAPSVTWWRGERMLPMMSAELEQRRDWSLVLYAVTLTSLGPYTCQAYNGKGSAASWTVTLKAVGPVYNDPNDVTYNQWLVPPPRSPTDTYKPHPPPYRPPRPQPTIPPVAAATPRVFVVPVKTTITLDKNTFPVDSDISIPCDVDGYPVPSVAWYKDGQPLTTSDKIQISESSRLTVVRASANDSGVYRCEAANQYNSSYSEVNVNVEGIYVDPLCTDNSFFADCQLVVTGKYCTHKWYGKFCCKSCTLAGQLPSVGPHLESLQRRRRSLPHH
ncbi:papilin isoform X2 [Macrosteles quadrilineatus]|uniref:papilin isoform X2 n=1 Tax=Macrosteles quadrilineatus TaxID=74068 RepID=UPI0023E2B5BC|nr:papilin isoform X2 [Macrosteles quadrilineatus]